MKSVSFVLFLILYPFLVILQRGYLHPLIVICVSDMFLFLLVYC